MFDPGDFKHCQKDDRLFLWLYLKPPDFSGKGFPVITGPFLFPSGTL
jgi:hypothetical protein